MFRIDAPFAVPVKPDKKPPATEPGFFSGGNPATGAMATRVSADWLNTVQEEIANVITEAGLDLNRGEDNQLCLAIAKMIAENVAPLASPAQNGLVPAGGEAGQLFGVSADGQSYVFRTLPPAYQIGEFRSWFEQMPPPGWAVRNGAVLTEADVQYPELWEYLQATVNEWKCKTLAEWTLLSTAAGGVGGVPFFVLDNAAKTIKLPDTRGDYERGAGSSYLSAVGGWHGDAIRNITGSASRDNPGNGEVGLVRDAAYAKGAFSAAYSVANCPGPAGVVGYALGFNASRVVPTATENRTRAFAVLPCVYVGGI